jgi:DNA-binding GntR family transcriptional regulator
VNAPDIKQKIEFRDADVQRIERVLLKDNTAELLRDYIIGGRIAPGAKLVERQISAALGVSRMPIRDALIRLEQQGLVVSRSTGRYVIDLSDRDARDLHQIRATLEILAVELAAERISHEEQQAIGAAIDAMRAARLEGERSAFVRADVEIHRTIWRIAKNDYLVRTLENILSPLLIMVANTAQAFDWDETLQMHEQIVSSVMNKDAHAARQAVRRHMDSIFPQASASAEEAGGRAAFSPLDDVGPSRKRTQPLT